MNGNFIDELLAEAESKEQQLSLEYADLVLIEIRNLEEQIEKNFDTASKEKAIIDDWAITRNSKLTDRKTFLEKKLETFLNEKNVKSLDLANGRFQKRMTPVRIEVVDLELFMEHANSDLLTIQPQSAKPDLNKIKTFYKLTRKLPAGTRLIERTEKFSIKLREHGGNNGSET